MRNPKRILEKIIGISHDFDRLEQTGESFEQLVEVLRDVMKCRLTRQWINNNYGFDIFVSPETFTLLLDIPQINFIENSSRTMELDTVSLKKVRKLGDPVTVGNLNALLRELYRNLESIQGRLQNDYPNPLLINAMRSDLIGVGHRTNRIY